MLSVLPLQQILSPRICVHCANVILLIRASRGARTAQDCAVTREPETTRARQAGGVTDFRNRDSRREKRQDCRKHKEREGKTGRSQMERATARKDEGDPGLTDGDGSRVRERWAELDAGFDSAGTVLQCYKCPIKH